jgi:hypothetical protein
MPEYADKTRYLGRIVNQGLSQSREKKTPCAIIRFEVLGRVTGPGTEEAVEHNYERDCTIWLTEKTLEFAERDLNNLGFGDFYTLEQINLTHPDCINLTGKEVEFYCQHEAAKDGSGKVYERWSVALQGGKSTPLEFSPVERPEVRRLDALFAKGKKTTKPMPVAVTAKNAHGAEIDDGDVPF